MRGRDGDSRGGRGGRGRGRGGRGRGGNNNNNNRRRGGGGGGRGRNNSWGRGRGRGKDRDPRAAAQSGNKRERIAIESGYLVLIDQFMLANPQFCEKLMNVVDEAPEAKDEIINQYGGTVVNLEPGTYRIERDPYAFTIVIHNDGEEVEMSNIAEEASDNLGRVFVDTRCLAMIDRELLDDHGLLEKYNSLWFGGQEKACRDLLRDNGGAVRYGFRRYGDELGVYTAPDSDIVCLWPDVAEPSDEVADSQEEAVA